MGRPLRIIVPNLPFHILNRGNNRQLVFREEEDFIYYLELLKRYKKELGFKLYHFILMPNHTHFQMEPTIEGNLSKIMQRLTLAHTWYFNKKYGGVGHVWQGRFKSSLIDKENYFLWCGLYIELNPVRAGLVQKPENWRYSSYNFYAQGDGETDSLIAEILDVDPYYLEFGVTLKERQEKYRKNMEEAIREEFLKNIRRELDEGVFGSPEFTQTMKEKFKIRSLKERGRPQKGEK
jgi:putative transposase